jgi:hypothetical protein
LIERCQAYKAEAQVDVVCPNGLATWEEIREAIRLIPGPVDGLLVPSARWDCQNLVVFTDQLAPEDMAVEESAVVDWPAWRKEAEMLRRKG